MKLYTIGHSAHLLERVINLLRLHEVRMLVDVRTAPHSRYHPQYRKSALEQGLAEAGIGYLFLGEQLGGRPKDPACFPFGELPKEDSLPWPRPDYNLVMQRPWFLQGIQRLLAVAAQQPTAIMCSEEDPANCHRHLLIATYLQFHYPEVDVFHIHGSGLLSEAAAMLDQHNQGDQLALL